MDTVVRLMLESGRSAVQLALYTLVPILVAMMVLMKILEVVKVLPSIERVLRLPLRVVGLPAPGIFAMFQLLFVNFAAPLESLKRMNDNRTTIGERELAATFATVLAMAQGNSTFPLVADGLSLLIIPISLVGGVAASSATYYLFAKSRPAGKSRDDGGASQSETRPRNDVTSQLIGAGEDGVRTALMAIPFLFLGYGLMNVLREIGVTSVLESALSPPLGAVRLPDVVALPMITKYLAGGTAMMGVAHDLITDQALSACDLNRAAGFLMNPCDLVGVPLLMAAGTRVRSVLLPALLGAAVGILVRGMIHLALF